MTFQDIFKSSFLENVTAVSLLDMGISLVLAVDKADADRAINILRDCGEKVCVLGEVIDGERGIEIC